MMLDKSSIFNIPANYHFFESLFYWLEKNYNFNQISEVKIFLPNRRACREFGNLFLQKSPYAILPKIKAISDISIDDFFDFLPNEEAKETIDEILQIKLLDGIDYLFFLSKEIQKLEIFGKNLDFTQAFKIATHLQKLFDEIEREEIDLKKLEEIDESTLSSHRQLTLDFLKSFHVQIKNSLLKQNIFFSTSYQNFIIQKFSELLQGYGSKSSIVIAGSTGSVSFSKKFIKAISQQKNCHVILYGLSDSSQLSEAENHPQFFLNRLIKFLEVEKSAIQEIKNKDFLLSDQARQNMLSLLMLQSEETIKWQKSDIVFDSKNFQLIESGNEIEEAKAIAIILKKSVFTKQKSALITNNDRLVSVVKSELNKLGISFNDTRNLKIFNSKLVNFLLLILELIESDFDSHVLLAILKNPLCALSQNFSLVAEFEIKILRQDRVSFGLEGILEKLKKLNDKNLINFFSEFRTAITQSKSLTLASQAICLIASAENLSKQNWQKLLEKEPAQIELFEFFEKLKLQTDLKIEPQNLLATFQALFAQISFFEKGDSMSSIQILSPLEARLLNFDLVIIASFNEGSFPEIESENWLGKKIKKDLEIDRTLKKIGQNAYDFCNYLSNKSVVLSRCKGNDGAVLIESPFLLKFKTLCQKLGVKIDEGAEVFALLKNLDRVQAKEIKPANPRPKVKFRPKKFSITEISQLLSDPYSIYAKKLLQLKELEKIDFEPSYAQFGSFIHKALEEFIKSPDSADFLEKSNKIFDKYFLSQEAKLIWWPKFENIFASFKEQNEQFFDSKNQLEIPVKLQLGEFLIKGKIDRVIFDKKENAAIFDYKTGQMPSKKDVMSGTEPQLTIAALAMVEGLIDLQLKNLDQAKISSLNYWKLSSSQADEIKKMCDKNEEIQILISAAKEGLIKLFEYFSNEENGYISTKNFQYSEYKHLARQSLN
jgi:ATP-dependent helicase/nuclease subunit B